jgi:hypothetical protein
MTERLILVSWIDPTSGTHGWKSRADVEKLRPWHVQSVGWVLVDDGETLIIVSTISNSDGDVDGEVAIPRSCVTSITELAVE